jgi:hypothetical protein
LRSYLPIIAISTDGLYRAGFVVAFRFSLGTLKTLCIRENDFAPASSSTSGRSIGSLRHRAARILG